MLVLSIPALAAGAEGEVSELKSEGAVEGSQAAGEAGHHGDAAGEAGHHGDAAGEAGHHGGDAAGHGGGHHAFHHHHVALFGGVVMSEGHIVPAVGLDYELRPTLHFGVTVFAEAAIEDPIAILGGAGLTVHPAGGLKLMLGAGAEVIEGHPALLIRASAGYDIHVGRFSLTPTVAVDAVHEHLVLVSGLGLGMGF